MKKHYRGKGHMYARNTVKIGRDKRRAVKSAKMLDRFTKGILYFYKVSMPRMIDVTFRTMAIFEKFINAVDEAGEPMGDEEKKAVLLRHVLNE